MSSRKKPVPQEEEKIEVVETATEDVVDEEISEDVIVVEEKKPSKFKAFVKRFWPFGLGMGIAIGAFLAGKASSANDEYYMAKLEDEFLYGSDENESNDETEEQADDQDTDSSEEGT